MQSFLLDYMHLVLLSVFIRQILILIDQWHKKLKQKLGIRGRACINRNIKKLYPDFQRIPTSI
jgi:hypothetical protein